VHFGDTLQLSVSLGSNGTFFLADNTFSAVTPGAIRVTASAVSEPQVRNTFVVERAGRDRSSSSSDTTVRYGDRIVLACNPALTVDPTTNIVGLQYVLQSHRANNVTGSGRNGRQECTMSTSRIADAEWLVLTPDMDRLTADGTAVRVGDPVVLMHAMSNQALAANASETIPTDFGVELDVHVLSYKKAAHASMSHTGDLPLMVAQSHNLWTFVAAADAAAAADTRGYRALTADALLERARGKIAAVCGFHGLRSLSLALASLDQRGNGWIPTDGAKLALIDHGVLQTEDEFVLMLKPFDNKGVLRPQELVSSIRGDTFSSARREIVHTAYDTVLATKSDRLAAKAASLGATTRPTAHTVKPVGIAGTVPSADGRSASISELKAMFDAKFDLRVCALNAMTAVEAAAEFARQWPMHQKLSDAVTLQDFFAYYEDVSAGVADDFEFVEMVSNLWHIPGHGNWKLKKGKRVLVTFHKGSSTECVIPESEDIADDDFEGLSMALKTLGFGGIARVKVLGTVEPE
jgi:hypothetical protein